MDYLSIATCEVSVFKAQSIHSIPETLAKKKYKTVSESENDIYCTQFKEEKFPSQVIKVNHFSH
jgi:hypothetical protein